MNRLRPLLCLLLALVLLFSLVPLTALASSDATDSTTSPPETPKTGTVTIKVVSAGKTLYTYKVTVGDKAVTLTNDTYITHDKKIYEFTGYTLGTKSVKYVKILPFEDTEAWKKQWGDTITVLYKAHTHKFLPSYNRIYHWDICKCGETTDEERHVDPALDEDKICTCGYKFSSNTDLVTLWLKNMELSPRFTKENHSYIGNVNTYKDVTSTTIKVKSFDALATITLPENLEIHEGANEFTILVTAEDKAHTATYTVIAVKPVKVDNILLRTDGTKVWAELKTKTKKKVASATVSDEVLERMVEMAAADKAETIVIQPKFSKWSITAAELTLNASLLEAMYKTTQADLQVPTAYGTVLTIPHSALEALSQVQGALTLRICKDNTFVILSGEETLTPAQEILLEIPEED